MKQAVKGKFAQDLQDKKAGKPSINYITSHIFSNFCQRLYLSFRRVCEEKSQWRRPKKTMAWQNQAPNWLLLRRWDSSCSLGMTGNGHYQKQYVRLKQQMNAPIHKAIRCLDLRPYGACLGSLFSSRSLNRVKKNSLWLISFFLLFLILLPPISRAQAQNAPQIGEIHSNLVEFANEELPQFGKLELTFEVATVAENVQWPYDANPLAGVAAETGVSVDALFSREGDEAQFIQPAFYYQAYELEQRGNRQWAYPSQDFAWKVRFSPHLPGDWSVQIRVTDAGGTAVSDPFPFIVIPSDNAGFVKVSSADQRYFITDNGDHFLGQGINAPLTLDEATLEMWQTNGIELVRTWIPAQLPIFGAAWSPWRSYNPLHNGQQPSPRLRHDAAPPFSLEAGDPPLAREGSDVFMWLAHDETMSESGQQFNFAPCMVLGTQSVRPPLQPSSRYRLTVRFRPHELEGPRIAGAPYGLAVKLGNNLWDRQDEANRCYTPDVGELLAASYTDGAVTPDPGDPNWQLLTAEYQSGDRYFFPPLNLVIENAIAGSVLVDGVWLEEILPDGSIGPNVMYKSWFAAHQYFDQRSSFMLDQFLAAAEAHDVRYKLVVLEKSDYTLNLFEPDGSLTAQLANQQDELLFYGGGREMSKTRWLQQAYWRYLQARWGYSTSVHSWELLNEGDPASSNHYALADEMGRYFAEAFVPEGQAEPHPNRHLVTTSFWTGFPREFWAGDDYSYIDYADIHHYAREGEVAPLDYIYEPRDFFDAALFSQKLSLQHGATSSAGANMPLVRGETGFVFANNDPFNQNETNGLWLHNFVWAGINSGGLMELYWTGAPTARHIASDSHNHFEVYGAFAKFMADVPLANGQYRPANGESSDATLRVWGQKDVQNGRFHLWLQNSLHTWQNVLNGAPIDAITANIVVDGFAAGESYRLEWWDTASGVIVTEETIVADAEGTVRFAVSDLMEDVAVKGYGAGIDAPIPPLESAAPADAGESDGIAQEGLAAILDNPLIAILLPVLFVSLVAGAVLIARRR